MYYIKFNTIYIIFIVGLNSCTIGNYTSRIQANKTPRPHTDICAHHYAYWNKNKRTQYHNKKIRFVALLAS